MSKNSSPDLGALNASSNINSPQTSQQPSPKQNQSESLLPATDANSNQAMSSVLKETKIIYHLDEEDTPYLIKLPICPDLITLGDLKKFILHDTSSNSFSPFFNNNGITAEGGANCLESSPESQSNNDITQSCSSSSSLNRRQPHPLTSPKEQQNGVVSDNVPQHNQHMNDRGQTSNNHDAYKFFFKSMDDDFGVVKEEIIDDKTRLPSFNGRVICWIISNHNNANTIQATQTNLATHHNNISSNTNNNNNNDINNSNNRAGTTGSGGSKHSSGGNRKHGNESSGGSGNTQGQQRSDKITGGSNQIATNKTQYLTDHRHGPHCSSSNCRRVFDDTNNKCSSTVISSTTCCTSVLLENDDGRNRIEGPECDKTSAAGQLYGCGQQQPPHRSSTKPFSASARRKRYSHHHHHRSEQHTGPDGFQPRNQGASYRYNLDESYSTTSSTTAFTHNKGDGRHPQYRVSRDKNDRIAGTGYNQPHVLYNQQHMHHRRGQNENEMIPIDGGFNEHDQEGEEDQLSDSQFSSVTDSANRAAALALMNAPLPPGAALLKAPLPPPSSGSNNFNYNKQQHMPSTSHDPHRVYIADEDVGNTDEYQQQQDFFANGFHHSHPQQRNMASQGYQGTGLQSYQNTNKINYYPKGLRPQTSGEYDPNCNNKNQGLPPPNNQKAAGPDIYGTPSDFMTTSVTESTMSLNVITVVINMDVVNFLGISIVGKKGPGCSSPGISVGSVMKGGAVARDGRIEPGDLILEVNGISLDRISSEEAIKVLRDAVKQPGPIKLVVAKMWDNESGMIQGDEKHHHFFYQPQESYAGPPLDGHGAFHDPRHNNQHQQYFPFQSSHPTNNRSSGGITPTSAAFNPNCNNNNNNNFPNSNQNSKCKTQIMKGSSGGNNIANSGGSSSTASGSFRSDPLMFLRNTNAQVSSGHNPVNGTPGAGGPPPSHNFNAGRHGIPPPPPPALPPSFPHHPPGGAFMGTAAENAGPSAENLVEKNLSQMRLNFSDGNLLNAAALAHYKGGGPLNNGPANPSAAGSGSTVSSGSKLDSASLLGVPVTDRYFLSVITEMCLPNSGLEIKDRNWLKLTIKDAFLGSDLVEWLALRGYSLASAARKLVGLDPSGSSNTSGHSTSSGSKKQDAKKLASAMLKKGYIKHSLSTSSSKSSSSPSFTEQCYYVINRSLFITTNHLHAPNIASTSCNISNCNINHALNHVINNNNHHLALNGNGIFTSASNSHLNNPHAQHMQPQHMMQGHPYYNDNNNLVEPKMDVLNQHSPFHHHAI